MTEVPGVLQEFTITTTGQYGSELLKMLEKEGFIPGNSFTDLCRSLKFTPEPANKQRRLIVVEYELFANINSSSTHLLTHDIIRKEAYKRGLQEPPVEVVAHLRQLITNQQFETVGYQAILVMHQTVNEGLDYVPLIFGIDGKSHIAGYYAYPYSRWHDPRYAMLFEVPLDFDLTSLIRP